MKTLLLIVIDVIIAALLIDRCSIERHVPEAKAEAPVAKSPVLKCPPPTIQQCAAFWTGTADAEARKQLCGR